MGFTASDVRALSDELVDRLGAWGSAGAVMARASEHLRAGEDQVVFTVLDNGRWPVIDSARQLAGRLPARRARESVQAPPR